MKSIVNLFMLVCLLGVAYGQNQLNPADTPTQSFGVDSINLENLSVSINLPVLDKPGAIPFHYSLTGTSGCEGLVGNPGQTWAFCGFTNGNYNGSWSFGDLSPLGIWEISWGGSDSYTCTTDGGTVTEYQNFFLTSPTGGTYSLPGTDYIRIETGGSACALNDHGFTDYTVSGGLKVTVYPNDGFPGGIVFPNGTTQGGGLGGLTDTFGNSISVAPGGVYTDTLGNNTFSAVLQSGSTGEIDTYEDTGGTSRQVKQILTTTTVKTAFGCSLWPDATYSNAQVVTAVDYPDGDNVAIAYEPISGGVTGRVSSLTLRTGGTISYRYGNMNCGGMIPSSLTRSDLSGTRTYTLSFITGGTTTTVLDPGRNKTVYTFQGTSNGLPVPGKALTLTQVQVYQNTGTVLSPVYSSTPNRTTLYCYNGNTSNCATTQTTYPITQKDIYVTLDNMSTSSRVSQTFDNYSNLTAISSFDFGASSFDHQTTIAYGSWNGSSCVAVGSSIINLPCDVKTTDSASHTIAEVRYTYNSKGFNTQTQKWTGSSW